MMMVNIYVLIFLMAAITFSCRYLFLMRKCPIVLSKKARKSTGIHSAFGADRHVGSYRLFWT